MLAVSYVSVFVGLLVLFLLNSVQDDIKKKEVFFACISGVLTGFWEALGLGNEEATDSRSMLSQINANLTFLKINGAE